MTGRGLTRSDSHEGSSHGLQDNGEWAALEDAAALADTDSRRVLLGPGAPSAHFQGNAITTSKYNILTFLPIFLFVMFSRVAYLYFLLQARPLLPLKCPKPNSHVAQAIKSHIMQCNVPPAVAAHLAAFLPVRLACARPLCMHSQQ